MKFIGKKLIYPVNKNGFNYDERDEDDLEISL
jgi:hypothetical protein